MQFVKAMTLAFAMLISTLASAASWPTKTVTIIVGSAAGGSADLHLRIIAEKLEKRWGQPVVILNKPGAAGMIGVDAAINAKDGHTIGQMAANPIYFTERLSQMSPVMITVWTDYVIVVKSTAPYKNWTEFVEYAKKKNGDLKYGTYNMYSYSHLSMESLTRMLGVKFGDMIPTPNEPRIWNEVGKGDLDYGMSTPAQVEQFLQKGDVRILATLSPSAMKFNGKTVPSLTQYVPEWPLTKGYQGMFMPRGTPESVIDKVNHDVIEVMKDPEVIQRLSLLKFYPAGTTPEFATMYLSKEAMRWSKVMADSNFKLK